ncbi:MAG: NAD+ synthase [Gammaproteobacteria bacterium]|nr:NAD+ synthase [Gammaproteobacteria bacterium]
MNTHLRIAAAQLNLCVGDVRGNVRKLIAAALGARDELRADVVVFPELALTGYPPEDLLLRADLHAQVLEGIEELKREISGIAAVLGYPHREDSHLYNAVLLLRDGVIAARYFKQNLPNYGVFDEKRYFTAGDQPCVVDIKGVPTALTICEDIWMPGPIRQAHEAGARLLININASPFHLAKGEERMELLKLRAQQGEMPIVYVNLVGGQDELVFDGESLAVDAQGQLMLRAPAFAEGLFPMDLQVNGSIVMQPGERRAPLSEEQSAYQALVLGVRDYVNKNGFQGVAIGVSGGIDSALTLAIAVDALGAERVEAVLMPSRYTATMSVEDGKAIAEALGVKHSLISIEPAFQAFLDSLKEEFAGLPADVTEENIQARCRGVILMAIANKKRNIVLSTGNKSEMSVGYATLYGDMAGGFAPLKDVPKLLVYRLAEYRNRIKPVIPRRVFERAPTAELASGQKDTDALPPYTVLDPILKMYVEQDKRPEDIVAAGFDEQTVRRVIRMVDRNEYKRRQAAPGVRITPRAFGRDRRYPITWGGRQ